MSWLKGLVTNWAVHQQSKEMTDFINRIAVQDGPDLGMPLALAYGFRNDVRARSGLDMLFPSAVLMTDPMAVVTLVKSVKRHQSDGNLVLAAGLLIWVHSLRAMADHNLRPFGRRMWGELARGFPHIDRGAALVFSMTATRLDLTGKGVFPDGLTPERL